MSLPTARYCNALCRKIGKLTCSGQLLCSTSNAATRCVDLAGAIHDHQRAFKPIDQDLRLLRHVQLHGLGSMYEAGQAEILENRMIAVPIEHADVVVARSGCPSASFAILIFMLGRQRRRSASRK